jgi:hypothetical protein
MTRVCLVLGDGKEAFVSEQAAARMKVIPKRRVWTTAAVALLAAAGVLVAVTPASAVPRFHHF